MHLDKERLKLMNGLIEWKLAEFVTEIFQMLAQKKTHKILGRVWMETQQEMKIVELSSNWDSIKWNFLLQFSVTQAA